MRADLQRILTAAAVCLTAAWPAAAAEPPSHYRPPLSYSTTRDPDPPKYARHAPGAAWEAVSPLTWLNLGLDQRIRWEYRDDDIRRPVAGLDEPFLFRTRAYLGVHDILDPFRFAVEMQDARRYHSDFPRDNRDVNEFELIRLYGELFFDDLLGTDPLGNPRPLSLRWGIHNFEFLDRRLIGNNQWRNTANTFRGFHGILGQESNDWQLDLLAVQPLERLKYSPDKPVDGQWLFGAIGHWRRWSDKVTLEPFYFGLLQESRDVLPSRMVHAPGLRAYGVLGDTGFDFDASAIAQFGHSGSRDMSGFGATAELGWRMEHPWKPRLSVFYGYASGDRDPDDAEDNRFERFFGFGRPWSANDYILFENISTPKLRVELTPHRKLRTDLGYSWYWLASATDRFIGGGIVRDRSGASGRSVGHEFDIRARWQIHPQLEAILGYAHFTPGEFTRRMVRPGDTDFLYLEFNISAF